MAPHMKANTSKRIHESKHSRLGRLFSFGEPSGLDAGFGGATIPCKFPVFGLF
jgi:hypothetical protein